MELLLRSAQSAPGGGEAIGIAAEKSVALISGPGPALWVGFSAFLFIFIAVLLLIIRGRVLSPARRKAMDASFFEPAGDEAEITFDQAGDEAEEAPKRKKKRKRDRTARLEKPDRPSASRDTGDLTAADNDDHTLVAEPDLADQRKDIRPEKPKSAFAGLFGRRKKDEPEAAPEPVAIEQPGPDHAEISIETTDDRRHALDDAHDDPYFDDQTERDPLEHEAAHEAQRHAGLERAEAERIAAEEAEHVQTAAAERNQIYREAREDAAREVEFDRRKAETALEQRMHSLAVMQKKLSDETTSLKHDTATAGRQLGDTLDRQFAALSDQLTARLENAATSQLLSGPVSTGGDPDITAYINKAVADIRDATEAAIGTLTERIDKLDTGAGGELSQQLSRLNDLLSERTAAATIGRIQLFDLVRSTLPHDRYAFSTVLPNGHKADCLVSMPNDQAPIAIDARYPVDAFDRYVKARNANAGSQKNRDAENEYRRAVLRHIVDIAENLVISGATADAAVMLAPSETIFHDLHENFADLVQDSYRARVWIVSPTSLMSTLHMMSAVAHNAGLMAAPERSDDEQALIAEIGTLGARVASLEDDLSHASGPAPAEGPSLAEGDQAYEDDFFSSAAPDDDTYALFDEPQDSSEEHSQPRHESLSPEELAFENLERKEALSEAREHDEENTYNRPPFPLR